MQWLSENLETIDLERDPRRSRLVAFSLFAVLIGPTGWAFTAWQGQWSLLPVIFATWLGYLAVFVGTVRGGSVRLLGHGLCGIGTLNILATAIAEGGPLGFVPWFSVLIPMTATMIHGLRAGWTWLAIELLTVWSLLGLQSIDLYEASLQPTLLDRAITTLVAVTLLAVLIQGASTLIARLGDYQHQLWVQRGIDDDFRLADLVAEIDQKDQTLRDTQVRLRAANAARRTLVERLSHELRTPVTTMIGYTEMVEEVMDDTGARHDLRRALVAANHLLGLVDSLVELARVSDETYQPTWTTVLMSDLVADVPSRIASEISARGNRLTVEVGREDAWVRVDVGHVHQILLALLDNANKFTDHGHLGLHARKLGSHVHIEIIDTGRGVAEDHLVELLGATPIGQRRVGMGLRVARGLAERMGGQIGASSELGRGSTFWLRLPTTDNPVLDEPSGTLVSPI